jgi:hypothetical protein
MKKRREKEKNKRREKREEQQGCYLWGSIWDRICRIFFFYHFFFPKFVYGLSHVGLWGFIWGAICHILFIYYFFFLNLCVGYRLCVGGCFFNFFLIVLVLLN